MMGGGAFRFALDVLLLLELLGLGDDLRLGFAVGLPVLVAFRTGLLSNFPYGVSLDFPLELSPAFDGLLFPVLPVVRRER